MLYDLFFLFITFVGLFLLIKYMLNEDNKSQVRHYERIKQCFKEALKESMEETNKEID